MKINEVLAYPDLFNNQIQNQQDLKRAEEYYKKTGKMPPADFWTKPTITHKGTNLSTNNELYRNQDEPWVQYRDQYDTDKYNDKFNKVEPQGPQTPSDEELRQQLINKLKQQNNPNQTYSHYGYIKDKENQEIENLTGLSVPATPQNFEKLQVINNENPEIRNNFKYYWAQKLWDFGYDRLIDSNIDYIDGFTDEIYRYEDNPDEYDMEDWQEEDEHRKYDKNYNKEDEEIGITLARKLKKLINAGSWDYLSKFKNPYKHPKDYDWNKTFRQNQEKKDEIERQNQDLRDREFKSRMAAIHDNEMRDIESRNELNKLQTQYMDANIDILRKLSGLYK
jgi:hypothetical protein